MTLHERALGDVSDLKESNGSTTPKGRLLKEGSLQSSPVLLRRATTATVATGAAWRRDYALRHALLRAEETPSPTEEQVPTVPVVLHSKELTASTSMLPNLSRSCHNRRQTLSETSVPSYVSPTSTVSNDEDRLAAALESLTANPLCPTRHIVYLEPSRHSPFLDDLYRFFRDSRKIHGPNEAHQYHPHCSVVGFFEVPLSLDALVRQELQDDPVDKIENNAMKDSAQFRVRLRPMQQKIIEIMESILEDLRKSNSHFSAPTILGLAHCAPTAAADPLVMAALRRLQPRFAAMDIHGPSVLGTLLGGLYEYPTLRVSIDVPWARQFAQALQCRLKDPWRIFVRPKKVDHVSLAYMDHYYTTRGALLSMDRGAGAVLSEDQEIADRDAFYQLRGRAKSSPSLVSLMRSESKPEESVNKDQGAALRIPLDMENLARLAQRYIDLDRARCTTQWDLVLYEQVIHSHVLSRPHQFRELHRWSNIC